ncbi:MAG: efflux RND transporter periplasmic adaptor subunit [Bdellovibrionales bacterium]|nr:efflux RND transporter periplasmic adaptor subunit [Bdellovibrionales bacterium]
MVHAQTTLNMNRLVVLLALGAIVLSSACTGQGNGEQKATPPAPVIVAEATQETFYDRVEALGTLKANEGVVLTPSVTETVTDINFEDGERVEQGTVLVQMTSAEENAQLEEARARLEEARRQYERIKPLAEGGSAPVSLVDQRRREYETAKAQLEAMQSRLKDRLVVAPFSGVLGIRNVSVGALVEPGDRITTIDDDSVMKLDFSVPTTYVAQLRPGLPILATAPAFDDRRFEGSVSTIDSRIDPTTRSIAVRALIPNPDRALKPGLLMSVELLKNERQALVIPESALIPEGSKSSVYLVEDQESGAVIVEREVRVGARRPGAVEILDGLRPGERVVTHGTLNVRPGQAVVVTAVQQGGETLNELLATQDKEQP